MSNTIRGEIVGDIQLYEVIGDQNFIQCVNPCISEYKPEDGVIEVLMICGKFEENRNKGIQNRERIHLTVNEDSFLAVFCENFFVVISEEYLNIRELIFLIDNEPTPLLDFVSSVLNYDM